MLQRAKCLGIKIWQLEKLQRMLNVLNDVRQGTQYMHSHNTRGNAAVAPSAAKTASRAVRTDLSQLLRNEQEHGSKDQDANPAASEFIILKGPHLFVYDMNEKTRPIMVRDYPKVQVREDGAWPQFRSASNGKCPFVEDEPMAKRRMEKEAAREEERIAREEQEAIAAQPRTRSSTATVANPMNPPVLAGRKRALNEMEQGVNVAKAPPQRLPETAWQPLLSKGPRLSPSLDSGFAPGREPMASGLQASNITSAIRSQAISSTTAAPGAKAGLSKEVQGLRERVLRENSGPLARSKAMCNIAGAARAANYPPARVAKQKAQEKLGRNIIVLIDEEMTQSEPDETDVPATMRGNACKPANASQMATNLKPGFCENCRQKFDNFEKVRLTSKRGIYLTNVISQHLLEKRHRKFATSREEWKELDSLLELLERPLRDGF